MGRNSRHDSLGYLISSLFFSYFFYVGVVSPYFSLYLDAKGFSVVEIAQLLAITSLLRIVGPWSWASWADQSSHPARLMLGASLLMLPLVLAFHWAQSFGSFALILVLLYFLSGAFGPISEALAVAHVGQDTARYGRLRLFGSIGFLLAVSLLGPLFDWVGVINLPWVAGLSVVMLIAVCWLIPKSEMAHDNSSAGVWERLIQPKVLLFFASALLMVFSHISIYTFYSLYLERAGYSKSVIGLLWATGVIAEITLFYFQNHLFQRFSLAALLAASFLVAALRFAIIGAFADSLWLLLIAQLLHAVTFALHHSASMGLIRQWFDSSQMARAQALFIIVAYGFGGTIGGLVLAEFWERIAPSAVFWAASVTALVGQALASLSSRQNGMKKMA